MTAGFLPVATNQLDGSPVGTDPRLVVSPVRGFGHRVLSVELDPVTGLLSFPRFHTLLPVEFRRALLAGSEVGLAIGDVDNMKAYVERQRAGEDIHNFGHLAGNRLMSQLGRSALRWFAGSETGDSCLATFGGDEVVFVALDTDATGMAAHVHSLATTLREDLPRSVSFAYGTFRAGPNEARGFHRDDYCAALVEIDRSLFRAKASKDHEAPVVLGLSPARFTAYGWQFSGDLEASTDNEPRGRGSVR